MNKWTFILFMLILLGGCSGNEERKVAAKVYDELLFYDEIDKEIKKKKIDEDTVNFSEIYINNWVQEQVLIHHSKIQNLNEQNSIDTKVENYRNQLLIHYYQNQLIEERLDTNITTQEVRTYYNKHKSDFQLKDYLVKVLYIRVSEDAPKLEDLGQWYKMKRPDDIENIVQYSGMYASNFYFDENNWVYFDEITKEIPLTDINKDRFITGKSTIKFKENGFYYFLNILDYKLKNAVSPIEFETQNIKKRILNKRVRDLRNSIKEELLQKAKNDNAITIY